MMNEPQGHARPLVGLQVQMYLEGDLQEIEVTSPDPNGAIGDPTDAPGSEVSEWFMSPMPFSGNFTRISVDASERCLV